jgi:hypothetical protein
VKGFPNLFFVLGPNTGLGHTSVLLMAEAQAGYIRQALEHVDRSGGVAVEPRAEAQRAWNHEIQRRSQGTVWLTGGCKSWYIDRNGRNSTLWPDHTFRFFSALRKFDPTEYVTVPAALPASPVEVPA